MEKHERYIIRPYEAVHLAKHHEQTVGDYFCARQMAALYRVEPMDEECALNFYKFIADVFNAGVISGKREERARRRGQEART